MASDPLAVLPGHGRLGKFVTDCTEVSLGGQGLEQLAGFERLVNLEVLWLHDNRLRCLSGLEHNPCIKQLYAHNNRLCTLKRSLTRLKFLTHLDLSRNQLKGPLSKVLGCLQKLHFLQELNLQGNPCCEEPQYRLAVLAALPCLKVLDHSEVTAHERQLAARLTASGSIKPPAAAFGSHIPPHPLPAAATAVNSQAATGSTTSQQQQAPQRGTRQQRHRQNFSVLELELELAQEVAAIRQQRQEEEAAADAALYAANPDAAYWEPRSSLPPNPALLKAQQTWAATTTGCAGSSSSSGSSVGATVAAGADWHTLAAEGCVQGTFSYRTQHGQQHRLCC